MRNWDNCGAWTIWVVFEVLSGSYYVDYHICQWALAQLAHSLPVMMRGWGRGFTIGHVFNEPKFLLKKKICRILYRPGSYSVAFWNSSFEIGQLEIGVYLRCVMVLVLLEKYTISVAFLHWPDQILLTDKFLHH